MYMHAIGKCRGTWCMYLLVCHSHTITLHQCITCYSLCSTAYMYVCVYIHARTYWYTLLETGIKYWESA